MQSVAITGGHEAMAGTLATGERQVVPSEVFRQEELYEGILYILSDGCVRKHSGNVEEGGRLSATECRHHIFIADDAGDVWCLGPTRQRTMGYHRTIASLCTLPFKVVVEHVIQRLCMLYFLDFAQLLTNGVQSVILIGIPGPLLICFQIVDETDM